MIENINDKNIFMLAIREAEESNESLKYDFGCKNYDLPIEVIIAYLKEFLKDEEEKFSQEFKAKFG